MEQKLFDGRLSIRVGQGGVNDEMMISTNSALFMNSSFGLPGLSAADLPSGGPSYPIGNSVCARSVPGRATRLHCSPGYLMAIRRHRGSAIRNCATKAASRFEPTIISLLPPSFGMRPTRRRMRPVCPVPIKSAPGFIRGTFADQLLDGTRVSRWRDRPVTVCRRITRPDFAVCGIVDQTVWSNPARQKQSVAAFLHVIGAPAGFNFSNIFVAAGF